MHLDRRLLGWGVFFVLLGAIPLAVRADILGADVVRRWWQLWPLLLVGWGLGLMLRRTPVDWLGGAITAVVFGIMGGGLIATGVNGFPAVTCNDKTATQAFANQGGTVSSAGRFAFAFDCGRLDAVTADGSDWKLTGASSDGNGPQVDAGATSVDIRPVGRNDFITTARKSDWQLTIPRTPRLDLSATVNAGEAVVDLAGAHLGSTSATVNAGSREMRLDKAASLDAFSASVNMGSATIALPAFSGSADVSVNLGSMDLCVPSGPGLRIHFSGGLGSQNLDSLGFTKIDQNTWVSPGYDSASVRTQMNVSANLGSFSLRVGGGCGA